MAMTEAQIQALYQVTYPINFVANGDTVHDGFHKHIQEIERIYGLLGGLERSKVTTGDLVSTLANYVTKTEFNNHVNSANPHPNLQLATLGGNLDVSRITGNWPLNRVSGTLGTGNMDINGLKSNLQSWVEGLGGGVSDQSISANGYLKFKNGLMIEWGKIPGTDDNNTVHDYDVNFHTPFPHECFVVTCGIVDNTNKGTGSDGASHNWGNAIVMRVRTLSKTGFTLYTHVFERRYIAIGY